MTRPPFQSVRYAQDEFHGLTNLDDRVDDRIAKLTILGPLCEIINVRYLGFAAERPEAVFQSRV